MISIEVAQQEHSDVRKKIFDYFTKYFKAEMDKLMKDTIARCPDSSSKCNIDLFRCFKPETLSGSSI